LGACKKEGKEEREGKRREREGKGGKKRGKMSEMKKLFLPNSEIVLAIKILFE
jgi:hypothetical protein